MGRKKCVRGSALCDILLFGSIKAKLMEEEKCCEKAKMRKRRGQKYGGPTAFEYNGVKERQGICLWENFVLNPKLERPVGRKPAVRCLPFGGAGSDKLS
jgi:hypothetical protein